MANQRQVFIRLQEESLQRAFQKMSLLKAKGENMRPIWEKFLTNAKKYFGEKYQYQGAPYGARWKGLNAGYASYKRSVGARGAADLILTGRLKEAVSGGEGWFENIQDDKVEFGVDVPYAAANQFGATINVTEQSRRYFWAKFYETGHEFFKNMALTKKTTFELPARPFFATVSGEMPGELSQSLVNIINAHFRESFN